MERSKQEIGQAIRAELLGPEFGARDPGAPALFDAPYVEFATEVVGGTLWARAGLDRRTCALLDVAILGALGRSQGLAVHVIAALRAGCTEPELQETLMHVTVFAGASAGGDAFRSAKAAIAAAKQAAESGVAAG